MGQHITILYLITATNAGGTEKALWELVRRLDAGRFTAHVCSLKKPGIFGPRLASAAAGFHTLGASRGRRPQGSPEFFAGLCAPGAPCAQAEAADHPLLSFSRQYLRQACRQALGVPIIISSLRVTEAGILPHFVDRMTAGMVDTYTAVSEAVRQEAISRAGIAPEKIITIPNGIECAELPACAAAAEAAGVFTVALPGRFHRQKGHAVLLHALKLLEGRSRRCGPFFSAKARMKRRLKKWPLIWALQTGCVSWALSIIPLRQWRAWMQSCCRRSGKACPMPCLRPWPGQARYGIAHCRHGRAGAGWQLPACCATPGNAEELAAALLRLARDRQLACAMGQAGRRLAREKFSIDATVAATVGLYDELHCLSCCHARSEVHNALNMFELVLNIHVHKQEYAMQLLRIGFLGECFFSFHSGHWPEPVYYAHRYRGCPEI